MTGHRERLMELGLLKPLSEITLYNRERTLERMAEGYLIQNPPVYVVYRADGPFSSIFPESPQRCNEAELIADKLTSYEAQTLCDKLNYDDPEQPRRHPYLPPLGMYRICHVSEWEAWEREHEQIRFWGE